MKKLIVLVALSLSVFHNALEAMPPDVLICQVKKNHRYQQEKDRIYLLIEKQVHHLRGLLKNWNNDPSMKLITRSASGEHEVRPNATFAADLAFLYRFGKYDSKLVGISPKELVEQEIIPVIRYLIRTHKTGDLNTDNGKQWGDAWQSAHWTNALGTAAWWSWEALPADIRGGVRRVVAYEADRIERTIPPHQVQEDSKSEENAWNSQVLSTALVLMPNDIRCAKWEKALQTWSLSAYLRGADANSSKYIDRLPVSQQFGGANIYDDFTLENHGFVHPDYMGAWIMNAGNDLDYLLTGRKPFESFLYNLSEIYNSQKRFLLPDAGYCYPNGQDWALFRNSDWIPSHATALARFNDPEALTHLRNALETAEKMQQRNEDGAIYAKGENYFPSAQPHLGYWLAQAWLVLSFAQRELKPKPVKNGVDYFRDGKIIINRTGNAFHSVAWGEKVMIQLMSLGKDHVVSPDQRNGIGRISVNDTLQPVILKYNKVEPRENGFTITMIVEHGKFIKAELICESDSSGRLSIQETLTAMTPCPTDFIETLSFGILNNPNWVFETGVRSLMMGEQKYSVHATTGENYFSSAKSVTVDHLDFELNEDSGIAYQTAAKMENSRYTDILALNAIRGKHFWKAGQVISKKKVIVSVK